ncbi:glyceraldehyde 3-phosphate dehydrogenase [Palleronia marisminoris]|uniref:Glyceraldehyde-3-phosphate dehydrogenase 2 n=1 Tax=Palleronia marisminoris TaxID=315423 RepID=A0A1Y5SUM5_9RHOB|nr:glyceraldehyde 3-phosphate dehydrogenase NAD-binding domain-containing protein [Palleronia marisminoris]SFG93166.1 glyceraldehyde 3-phosphate dehydrogenase [Palleronia marisminoris]SLN45479.1 Glyceraldehyde-3-phosphate dehydrogenase 2 [Palleronia marisminoris]
MSRTFRVFINGFGRIGRTLFRQIMYGGSGLEIVGINDIASLDICAYLLRYDSVYGPFPSKVDAGKGWIELNHHRIAFSNLRDLRDLDLSGVDVVLECTGRALTQTIAEAGLDAGARAVLVSGPSPAAETTVVRGVNEQELRAARIVSNASCTTNAIAPLLRKLDLGLGIEKAHVTTIHCYTGSQPTVDAPGLSPERSRAAAVSMIPTTTSAAEQVIGVLPEFQGRLSMAAVRVPCLSVSAIDAVIQTCEDLQQPVIEFLREAFEDSPLIGLTDDPCVSTDFRARPESLVLALRETMTIGSRQLRLLGWYDNEWGFSARMIETARRMAARSDPVA